MSSVTAVTVSVSISDSDLPSSNFLLTSGSITKSSPTSSPLEIRGKRKERKGEGTSKILYKFIRLSFHFFFVFILLYLFDNIYPKGLVFSPSPLLLISVRALSSVSISTPSSPLYN